MLTENDLSALLITLKLTTISTFLLLILSMPLAWWLARTQWRFKFMIEAVIALPLVLPPTVLGFYLLMALGSTGPVGQIVQWFGGSTLAFSFKGLVIGSMIYSLPFVVQPLQAAFASINHHTLEIAATLRASPSDRFFSVILPLARPGILTACVLGFAHTIGEFGVVLMIGGNIPGETQVLSIAIYDHVEAMEYHHAHLLSGGLLVFSFLLLMLVYAFNRRFSVIKL